MDKPIFLAALLLLAGCVDVNQHVQVDRPTDTVASQDVTQKCPMRPVPVQMIRTLGSTGSDIVRGGAQAVPDQGWFDKHWAGLTVEPGQAPYTTLEGTNKPLISWNTQQALFMPFGKVVSTCHRFAPPRIETDCLKVVFSMSQWTLTQDCQSVEVYPVYVFIYPKSGLPMEFHWTPDADGDGISNESEVQVGTDPMDPKSKP